jgi:putative hydrolase of the HAD superfamily
LQLLDFLKEILEVCAVEKVGDDQLKQAASQYEQAICAQAVPLEAAQETLALLKGLGYQIGLLSNTMFSGSAHIADLKRFALDSYFDAMLFSADAGKWKPSPDPYLDLLNQLNIAPEQSVFVGDDPANDMIGGQKAGLRTILMRSSERFHLPDSIKPDATIAHLSELPGVLSRWSNEN